MNVLILFYEVSMKGLLQSIVESEEHTVRATPFASEALQAIAETIASGEPTLLLADNFHLNPEATDAFTLLREQPPLRRHIKIIGVSAVGGPSKWIVNDLIDDHLSLPFSSDQLIALLDACQRDLSNRSNSPKPSDSEGEP